ncbi:MAG: GspH/FimT family pseudopilin [Pseudohongiellaceae bacterium]
MHGKTASPIARSVGITLLEMLIVVAILSIVLTVGLPSFTETAGRIEAGSASRSLQSALGLAKSEAAKRGLTVSVCPTTDGQQCAAGQWNNGWIVFVDANGDASGGAGSIDANDTIIQISDVSAQSVVTATTNLIQYDSRGYGLNDEIQTLTVCPPDGNAENARQLEIGITGRVRLIVDDLTCAS